MKPAVIKHYLLACDFDQTLSFNDSGHVLSELLGVRGFADKVAGLASSHLVQQGGELAYLIRHDPEFRGVRREHLIQAGRCVQLRSGIPALMNFLRHGLPGCRFSFFVISAAPREIVVAALAGIVPEEHIHGTVLDYDLLSGEVRAISRVPAGYGKVAVLDALARQLGVESDRIIYIGDGSSDVHVMLHVNNGDGFTIAVAENVHLSRIASSTIISDSAFSVLLPILNQVLGMRITEIRAVFEANGVTLHNWERERTERVMIREAAAMPAPPVEVR